VLHSVPISMRNKWFTKHWPHNLPYCSVVMKFLLLYFLPSASAEPCLHSTPKPIFTSLGLAAHAARRQVGTDASVRRRLSRALTPSQITLLGVVTVVTGRAARYLRHRSTLSHARSATCKALHVVVVLFGARLFSTHLRTLSFSDASCISQYRLLRVCCSREHHAVSETTQPSCMLPRARPITAVGPVITCSCTQTKPLSLGS
jgi:hypothetical protein